VSSPRPCRLNFVYAPGLGHWQKCRSSFWGRISTAGSTGSVGPDLRRSEGPAHQAAHGIAEIEVVGKILEPQQRLFCTPSREKADPCLLEPALGLGDDAHMIRAPIADALCLTVLLTVILAGVAMLLQRSSRRSLHTDIFLLHEGVL
jgi:hypothetical protein